jgi:tetratricopeptide (TPR) repeat protein
MDIEKKLNVLFDLQKYKDVLELAYENLYNNELERELLYEYIILSHINLEEYHKALEISEEALGIYPSFSIFLYFRSKSFYYISSYKNAIDDIEEALNIEPNEPRYLAHFARILLFQNEYIKAKEIIERALEIDSSVSEYHLTLAIVLYMLDGERVAKEIVDEVLTKEPHNLQALEIKRKYFTPKLKEQKSLLKNFLFLNPFDKESQKDIKFIKYYYIFLPPLMGLVLFLSYLLQS